MAHKTWFEDCSQEHPYGDGWATESGGINHEICNICENDMEEDRICNDICDECFYKLVTFENCIRAGADKSFKDDYKYNAFLEWMFDPEELVDILAKELKETLEQEKRFSIGERWTEKAMHEWAGNYADDLVEYLTN